MEIPTLLPNKNEKDNVIRAEYTERMTIFEDSSNTFKNVDKVHKLETQAKVPKLGVMIVGLGGNNGTTFTAGILANKYQTSWETKKGMRNPDFYGSFTQMATAHCGYRHNVKTNNLEDVHVPIKEILPMTNPIDFEISGWDISGLNLYESCKRAQVLEPALVNKLKEHLENITPLPAAFTADYIASNQSDRVDNIIKGTNSDKIKQIRADIQAMKLKCDKVVLLWSANTEMFYLPEIQKTEDLHTLIKNDSNLPASVLYCVAAIEEQCLYLNGSPQNTFHPAIVQYAKEKGGLLAGNDFKSGQTRFKTVMSDFIIGSGIRLSSCVSYNHLGNNDGKNLQEDKCFQSKRISKAGVIDDAIKANPLLYPRENNKIDHEVIIKYVPFVGDSKRALDEYSSEIFMGGTNTISSYNVCEDSLLATPLMIDMIILGELFTRIKIDDEKLGPVLSYLSFFFKAPITNHGEYVINSFSRQREMLVNFLKVCAGLIPDDGTLLSFKF
jgi:myo-inositol-1-phosphate synthase